MHDLEGRMDWMDENEVGKIAMVQKRNTTVIIVRFNSISYVMRLV